MSKHSIIGAKGEKIAADYLLKKGYIVLFTNWRAGKKEVDLIVQQDKLVVFVEVKTRSSAVFGYPEEAVNQRKQQYFRAAAEVFMEQHRQPVDIRFDIVSVLLQDGLVREIVHFEEAFH